jgi:HPt (histidine-containing phosphotransfer) domain-containing protein
MKPPEEPLPGFVDMASLELLRGIPGEEGRKFLSGMIGKFLGSSRAHVANLKEAAARKDADMVREIAHTLKTSSAWLGALRLSRLCHALEKREGPAARENILADAEVIEEEFHRVRTTLEAIRQKEEEEKG